MEYKAWRTAVFKRDHYTCKACFEEGKRIHAHHIFGWKDHPELRYVVDNGITLCKKCHHEAHFGDIVIFPAVFPEKRPDALVQAA